MKKIAKSDTIAATALPTRCPACGVAGAPITDGQWPEVTRVSCPHACGWFARYAQEARV